MNNFFELSMHFPCQLQGPNHEKITDRMRYLSFMLIGKGGSYTISTSKLTLNPIFYTSWPQRCPKRLNKRSGTTATLTPKFRLSLCLWYKMENLTSPNLTFPFDCNLLDLLLEHVCMVFATTFIIKMWKFRGTSLYWPWFIERFIVINLQVQCGSGYWL